MRIGQFHHHRAIVNMGLGEGSYGDDEVEKVWLTATEFWCPEFDSFMV